MLLRGGQGVAEGPPGGGQLRGWNVWAAEKKLLADRPHGGPGAGTGLDRVEQGSRKMEIAKTPPTAILRGKKSPGRGPQNIRTVSWATSPKA